jgi:DNA polymerase-3 subunit epsilon
MFDHSKTIDLENLCAFDFETTGISAGSNRVVEIGACRFVDGKFEVFERLVNPGMLIPLEAKNIHGIGNKDVADAPKFKDIVNEFLDFVGDRALIAHNSNFDLEYLVIEMQRGGFALLDTPVIDTLRMSRALRKGAMSHKLSICHEVLCGAKRDVERHRAGGDSRACLEIAREMFNMKKDAPSRQIRHHMDWAGGTVQFKDHNFSMKSVGLDNAWYFDMIKVGEEMSVVYTKGVNEDVMFGKPVAFYCSEGPKKPMNIVIDHTDGTSSSIPLKDVINISV